MRANTVNLGFNGFVVSIMSDGSNFSQPNSLLAIDSWQAPNFPPIAAAIVIRLLSGNYVRHDDFLGVWLYRKACVAG